MSLAASIGLGLAALFVLGFMLWLIRNMHESVREHGELTRDDIYAFALLFTVLLIEFAGFAWLSEFGVEKSRANVLGSSCTKKVVMAWIEAPTSSVSMLKYEDFQRIIDEDRKRFDL
jgi:hypothetical protein